jgi:long-chain acyl-CoA synthetase
MPESAIVAAVRAAASRAPQRTALVFGDAEWTHAALEQRAGAVAAHLAAHTEDEILGLFLPNHPAFASALLGGLWAGKTVAVLPTVAPPPLLNVMAAEAGLTSVVTSAELAPRLTECGFHVHVLENMSLDESRAVPLVNRTHEAAVLLYTSGTTGRPKAVALSDQNTLSNIEGCCQAAGFGADEVMMAVLPLFHAYGLTVTLLLPLVLGGTTVLLERFHPRALLQAIEKHRGTCLVAVPSQYRLLVKEPTWRTPVPCGCGLPVPSACRRRSRPTLRGDSGDAWRRATGQLKPGRSSHSIPRRRFARAAPASRFPTCA